MGRRPVPGDGCLIQRVFFKTRDFTEWLPGPCPQFPLIQGAFLKTHKIVYGASQKACLYDSTICAGRAGCS